MPSFERVLARFALDRHISARARRDLIEIGAWIARDDADAADRFVERLVASSEQIGVNPLLYPMVEDGHTLHKMLVAPYLILYRVRCRDVLIVTIRHGARHKRGLR